MLLALLIAAAAPAMTAIDAERAFAAAAQTDGQWTAFRRYATENAVMFVPQVVKAQEFLKDREDPPKAIEWWPTESYVSCDETLAINTGGWKRPDGAVGYFTTVWQRQADGGWKWIVDGGDELTAPRERPAEPKLVKPDCATKAIPLVTIGAPPSGSGQSKDSTLNWYWAVEPDLSRQFSAKIWNGHDYVAVIDNDIAAPPK
ncbi:hypothetical protein [Sphingomonas sp.]|uniref:hypothetical protein n=1 Tax=Sphingomonas sp. TaxID=28214 RepID=UPI003D6D8547